MSGVGPAEAHPDLGDLLVRLAGERGGPTLLVGEDAGPAAYYAEVWPERVVAVGPPATRLAVAEGIRRGGGSAVVVLGAGSGPLVAPEAPVVVVSVDPADLGAAHRAGMAVCQPGWPADLAPLLEGALAADGPVLLHLPSTAAGPDVGEPDGRAAWGEQRVLHRGRAGLVVGAGPTAPAALRVARALALEGVEVTALDLHTIEPSTGLDATLLQDALLVGSASTPRAAALEAVGVSGPGVLLDRVRAALPGA